MHVFHSEQVGSQYIYPSLNVYPELIPEVFLVSSSSTVMSVTIAFIRYMTEHSDHQAFVHCKIHERFGDKETACIVYLLML